MSQRAHVVLEDDVEGCSAEETILLAVDGVNYEINLNEATPLACGISSHRG